MRNHKRHRKKHGYNYTLVVLIRINEDEGNKPNIHTKKGFIIKDTNAKGLQRMYQQV